MRSGRPAGTARGRRLGDGPRCAALLAALVAAWLTSRPWSSSRRSSSGSTRSLPAKAPPVLHALAALAPTEEQRAQWMTVRRASRGWRGKGAPPPNRPRRFTITGSLGDWIGERRSGRWIEGSRIGPPQDIRPACRDLARPGTVWCIGSRSPLRHDAVLEGLLARLRRW